MTGQREAVDRADVKSTHRMVQRKSSPFAMGGLPPITREMNKSQKKSREQSKALRQHLTSTRWLGSKRWPPAGVGRDKKDSVFTDGQ